MKIEREEFEKEKNHLNETVSLIRKKISNLGQELYDDDSKIQRKEKQSKYFIFLPSCPG